MARLGQYDACFMEGGFDIDVVRAGNAADVGKPVVIPQVALADDEYGWALIAGQGSVQVDATVAAGAQVNINSAGHLSDAGDHEIGPAIWVQGRNNAGVGRIFIAFPTKVA